MTLSGTKKPRPVSMMTGFAGSEQVTSKERGCVPLVGRILTLLHTAFSFAVANQDS